MSAIWGKQGRVAGIVTPLMVALLAVLPWQAAQGLVLAWNPNPETNIAGYIIYQGGSSGVYTNALHVGKTTAFTIRGLNPSGTYFFAVTAYNTSGLESDPSNELRYPGTPVATNNVGPTLAAGTTFLTTPKGTPRPVPGLQISDPDAGTANMSLTLTANRGTITVLTNVPSGVVAGNVTFNSSANVLVSAPLAALNATLSRSNGVVYTGHSNLVGGDLITITVNDNGNTGAGGARSDSRQINVDVTGEPVDGWRNTYFAASDLINASRQSAVWGDLADPDRDGRANLLEYALGLNPISGETTNGVVEGYEDVAGRKCYTLAVRKRSDDPALQIIPMVTTNDVTWTVATNQTLLVSSVSTLGTNLQLIKFQEVPAATNMGNRKYYLRVVRNTVESRTESFMAGSVHVKGYDGSSSGTVMFSLPMVGPIVSAGFVTSLGTNSLTDTNANWRANQFNGTNGSYYLEFDSGLMADILRTDQTNRSLVLYSDIRPAVTNGFAYRIRKHLTISSVFGARNEAGLSEVDQVQLQRPGVEPITLFYNNTYQIWLSYNDADTNSVAGSTVIYPEQGIYVIRRSSQDLKIHLHGCVKETDTQVPIYPGFNLVGTLQAVKSLRLTDLNLDSGKPDTGMMAALNSDAADNLWVYDFNNTPNIYWRNSYDNHWYNVRNMDVDADNDLIHPGSAFFIQRKAPSTFLWTIPAQ